MNQTNIRDVPGDGGAAVVGRPRPLKRNGLGRWVHADGCAGRGRTPILGLGYDGVLRQTRLTPSNRILGHHPEIVRLALLQIPHFAGRAGHEIIHFGPNSVRSSFLHHLLKMPKKTFTYVTYIIMVSIETHFWKNQKSIKFKNCHFRWKWSHLIVEIYQE